MRSFGRALAFALVVLAPAVYAQTSQPKRLYDDALARERILRQDLQRAHTEEAQSSVLTRIRALAGAYDDMSRLFPSSGYADNALWQGAVLAADAFWQLGDAPDRTMALRLFSSLTSRFPASSLTTKVSSHTKRLQDAKPTTTAIATASVATTANATAAVATTANATAAVATTANATAAVATTANATAAVATTAPAARAAATTAPPSQAVPPTAAASTAVAPTAPPMRASVPSAPPAPTTARSAPPRAAPASRTSSAATGLAALPAALTGITREVLPEVLRIVIQLGKEVTFYDERIDGPPRVFLDLHHTRAIEPLKDAVIPFPDDVVKQVRIGRQPNSRTRVVLDLKGSDTRYSVYTLYDPYRIVVDFERKRASTPARDAKTEPTREGKIAPTSASSIAPTSVSTIASTNEARIAPTSVSPIAPTSDSAIAPTSEGTIAPTSDRVAEPPSLETPPPAPLPPSTNASGGFSLSRQLGLGATRIVIDAGHGGHDPGAKARGIQEADLVLDVALRLEKLLKAAGMEVLMTRRTDIFIPLEERTAIANRAGADLFLSIHSNASASDAAHGVETYFLNFAPNPQAEAIAARENAGGSRTMRNLPDIVRAIALNNKIDESRDFAGMVQTALYTKLQKSNRYVRNLGVKQAPFMVLVGATMPSVLAEISFITNRQEATLLKTEKYKQQIAEALLAGILRYQQALKKVPAIAAQRP
jgi:N-acetylmuramoyl-L-alanine amidase